MAVFFSLSSFFVEHKRAHSIHEKKASEIRKHMQRAMRGTVRSEFQLSAMALFYFIWKLRVHRSWNIAQRKFQALKFFYSFLSSFCSMVFFLFISQRNSEWHSILIRLKRIANPSCLKAIAKKNSTIQFHLISVLSFRKWLLCARETNKMTAAHTNTHTEKKYHEPLKVWNWLENLITNN